MLEQLPAYVEPLLLADAGQQLRGQLALVDLRRLTALLYSTTGQVDAELEFGRDEQNLRYLRISIDAELEVVCQRCLQPLRLSLNIRSALGLVKSRLEADKLPEHYEPLLVEQQTMSLAAIIEDELILELPAAPKHEDDHCGTRSGAPKIAEQEVTKNPFAVLSRLKNTQ